MCNFHLRIYLDKNKVVIKFPSQSAYLLPENMMEQKFVTRVDCDNVMKKCLDNDKFEVVNFKVKPFEDKEREYYKPDCILEISVKISKNISRYRFFLKQYVTEFPALNDLLKSVRASEREIVFYEQFLPMMSKALVLYESDFVPYYLYAQLNRIIVIEDMLLKFFTPAKKANPHLLDRFHIGLVLKALAKLHAASLSYEEKLKDAEGARLFDENDVLAYAAIWRNDNNLGQKVIQSSVKGLKTLMKEYKQVSELDEKLNNKIDELVQKTYDILKFQTEYRNVLGHGDLQTKNILFKYDKNNIPLECVLLNFGFCRYFLPAHDVLTIIFNCSDQLFRQHYFTYLIQYYYDCLHNELMKQELHIDYFMSFDQYKQTINYLMPAIKLKALFHIQDFGAKPGFYKLINRDENLHRRFMYEDKSPFIQEMYKKDPLFKNKVIEALEEIVEIMDYPQLSRESCYEILESRLETTTYDLKKMTVVQTGDTEGDLKVTLEVAAGQKEKYEVNTYEYLVNRDSDNSIKVLT